MYIYIYTYYTLHTLQQTVTHCNTLQHAATNTHIFDEFFFGHANGVNTLQQVATHCNRVQHAATHTHIFDQLFCGHANGVDIFSKRGKFPIQFTLQYTTHGALFEIHTAKSQCHYHLFIWDMTHSYGTQLIHMGHDSFIRETAPFLISIPPNPSVTTTYSYGT